MGRRKKAKSAQALLEQHTAGGAAASPIDKTHLADCLSQTSKIAAECNSILRDLLRGRCVQALGFNGQAGPGRGLGGCPLLGRGFASAAAEGCPCSSAQAPIAVPPLHPGCAVHTEMWHLAGSFFLLLLFLRLTCHAGADTAAVPSDPAPPVSLPSTLQVPSAPGPAAAGQPGADGAVTGAQ
jgi:hypothetical protein